MVNASCGGGAFRIFPEFLPMGGEDGGDLIFTREANIAEMNVSEPSKNIFQCSSKMYL